MSYKKEVEEKVFNHRSINKQRIIDEANVAGLRRLSPEQLKKETDDKIEKTRKIMESKE